MPTLNWTGQRSGRVGLLYLEYTNLAEVIDHGKKIGEVFALPNGYYRPSIDGIRDDDCATPDQAALKVVELHQKFRD